jgi:plasmid replication initiation protein
MLAISRLGGAFMPRTLKPSENELAHAKKARDKPIFTADTLLQKGRFELTITEQRIILYAITQIKPDDEKFKEYTLKIQDLYDICGLKDESYTEFKKIIQGLQRKFWWILMEDPHEPGTECESSVNWFTIARTNKKSGRFTLMFHPDMMVYLLELSKQYHENKLFYTQMLFRYMLPMKSTYAVRLYQLLKSYQKNNAMWYFPTEELKRLLDCLHYERFADFRRFALEPAIREINKYTDINVSWEATDKEGKRITEITFYMTEKDINAKLEAEKQGTTELDGQIHWWDLGDQT